MIHAPSWRAPVAELGNPEPVARARDAVARRAWQEAYDLLSEADRVTPGHRRRRDARRDRLSRRRTGRSGDAWKRVHAARLSDGDREGAAAAAVRVAHVLFDEGLEAPLRVGDEAELLADLPDSPVHAALSIEMADGLDLLRRRGDGAPGGSTGRSRSRTAPATRRPARSPSTRKGAPWSNWDRSRKGWRCWTSRPSPRCPASWTGWATVVLFCSTVCAPSKPSPSTTEPISGPRRWSSGPRTVRSARSRACRVHRAGDSGSEARGTMPNARLAERAKRSARSPEPSRDGRWGAGSVRLRMGNRGRRGRVPPSDPGGMDPQPGIALLRLAQGDPRGRRGDPGSPGATGADQLGAAAQHGAPTGPAPRGPGGHRDRRRRPRARVGRPRSSTGSRLLRIQGDKASAATARGTVMLAEKDRPEAIRNLEDGAIKWKEIGAPYESARARATLAQAHRLEGNEEAKTNCARPDRRSNARGAASTPPAPRRRWERSSSDGRVPEAVDKVFLFTDIVQSTNLAEAIGDEAWGRLVHRHNQKTTSLVLAHGVRWCGRPATGSSSRSTRPGTRSARSPSNAGGEPSPERVLPRGPHRVPRRPRQPGRPDWREGRARGREDRRAGPRIAILASRTTAEAAGRVSPRHCRRRCRSAGSRSRSRS